MAKIADEATTRRRILDWAKVIGCEFEARKILDKYDHLLKNCTNEEERKDMAKVGIVELHQLLDCYGGLTINGKNVISAKK